MIPAKSDMNEAGAIPSLEDIEFTIGDPRKMMQIGARQYSDTESATIRELVCNALDAHTEAGIKREVQVTLPGPYTDYFMVKDFGTGMSLEDFRKVYTVFGYSTKEKTNDQTGCLGLGSKAPLAYTDNFTVTSVKDGHKTVAYIKRRPDWSIVLQVASHSKTDEPNGTSVKVPVHNFQEFSHKASDYFKFLLPGKVLVNGKSPEHAVGEKIADNLYYSDTWNMSYVVMGNVPYRIINSDALFRGSKIGALNFVAYVSMDEEKGVDFTPSREDLEYTERTKRALRRIIDEFETEVVENAKADIDSATTHAEAYAKWSKWTKALGSNLFSELTFKGDKFTNTIPLNAVRYQVNGGRYSTYRINHWYVSNMDNAMIVTGFGIDLNSNQKKKTREWLTHKGIHNINYVLYTMNDSVDSPWIDQSRVVDWETIKEEAPKAPRKPRQPVVGGRIPGSWDYYMVDGSFYEKALPAKGDVYYITVKDDNDRGGVRNKMKLLDMPATAAVIRVPANRLAKFKRENPKVKEFLPWAEAQVDRNPIALLSQDAKTVLDMDSEDRQWLTTIDSTQIKDPEWVRLAGLIKQQSKLTKKYNDALALASEFGMYYTVKKYDPKGNGSYVTKRYPLLDSMYSWQIDRKRQRDDVILYVNAKHKSLKKGN